MINAGNYTTRDAKAHTHKVNFRVLSKRFFLFPGCLGRQASLCVGDVKLLLCCGFFITATHII